MVGAQRRSGFVLYYCQLQRCSRSQHHCTGCRARARAQTQLWSAAVVGCWDSLQMHNAFCACAFARACINESEKRTPSIHPSIHSFIHSFTHSCSLCERALTDLDAARERAHRQSPQAGEHEQKPAWSRDPHLGPLTDGCQTSSSCG